MHARHDTSWLVLYTYMYWLRYMSLLTLYITFYSWFILCLPWYRHSLSKLLVAIYLVIEIPSTLLATASR